MTLLRCRKQMRSLAGAVQLQRGLPLELALSLLEIGHISSR